MGCVSIRVVPVLVCAALLLAGCDPAPPQTYGMSHYSQKGGCTNEAGAPYKFHVTQHQVRAGRPTIELAWFTDKDYPDGPQHWILQRDGGPQTRVVYDNVVAENFGDGYTRDAGRQTVVTPGATYVYQLGVVRALSGIHWSCVRLQTTWNGITSPDYGYGW